MPVPPSEVPLMVQSAIVTVPTSDGADGVPQLRKSDRFFANMSGGVECIASYSRTFQLSLGIFKSSPPILKMWPGEGGDAARRRAWGEERWDYVGTDLDGSDSWELV